MANNLGVTTGSDAIIKTTDNASVHTPHHIVDSSALPTGAATSANQTTIIGHVDGIETLIGTTNSTLTTIDGRVDGVEALLTTIDADTSNIATALGTTALDLGPGTGGTRTLRVAVDTSQLDGSEYETVAASQSTQTLGATGATGDYLRSVLVIPVTTSPGNIQIKDGAGTAITVFAGGSDSVSNLVPFTIDIGAVSTAGAWQVTTGANVSAIGFGNFT